MSETRPEDSMAFMALEDENQMLNTKVTEMAAALVDMSYFKGKCQALEAENTQLRQLLADERQLTADLRDTTHWAT